MFGLRLSSLFRNRWLALGWALMICFSAASFVAERKGSADGPQDASVEAMNSAIAAMR